VFIIIKKGDIARTRMVNSSFVGFWW